MIIDKTLMFSDDQAITGDAASTNVIDLGADRDLGVTEGLWVCIAVTETFDSAGEAATVAIALQTDSVENFASPTALFSTGTIAEATLVAGYGIKFKLPQVTERYLRLNFDNGTEVFTSGKVKAWLGTPPQNWRAYDAVTGV